MCTLHDFSVLKSNLFIRALLLDRILVTEKTTRTPRVHLVIKGMNSSYVRTIVLRYKYVVGYNSVPYYYVIVNFSLIILVC